MYLIVDYFGVYARTSETIKKLFHSDGQNLALNISKFFHRNISKKPSLLLPMIPRILKMPTRPATGSAEMPQKPRLVPVQGPAQDPPTPLLTRSAGVVLAGQKMHFLVCYVILNN